MNLKDLHNNTDQWAQEMEHLSFRGVVLANELAYINAELERLRGLLPLNKLEYKLELQTRKRELDFELRMNINKQREVMAQATRVDEDLVEYRKVLFPKDGETLNGEHEISLEITGRPLEYEHVADKTHLYFETLKEKI